MSKRHPITDAQLLLRAVYAWRRRLRYLLQCQGRRVDLWVT